MPYYPGKAPGARLDSNNQDLEALPNKLKCSECLHEKPHLAFAKNRIDFVIRVGIRNQNAMRRLICLECSRPPPSELECQGTCGKTKGLDKFSKTQRSSPDTAICKACMWDRGEVQPGNMRDFRSDTKDKAEDESDEEEMTSDVASITHSMNTTSIDDTRSTSHTLRRCDDDDDEYELVGNPSLATSRASTSSKAGSIGTAGSMGTARPSSGAADSTASSFSRPDSNGEVTSSAGGWAKIKNVQRPLPPRPEDSDDGVELDDEDTDEEWDM